MSARSCRGHCWLMTTEGNMAYGWHLVVQPCSPTMRSWLCWEKYYFCWIFYSLQANKKPPPMNLPCTPVSSLNLCQIRMFVSECAFQPKLSVTNMFCSADTQDLLSLSIHHRIQHRLLKRRIEEVHMWQIQATCFGDVVTHALCVHQAWWCLGMIPWENCLITEFLGATREQRRIDLFGAFFSSWMIINIYIHKSMVPFLLVIHHALAQPALILCLLKPRQTQRLNYIQLIPLGTNIFQILYIFGGSILVFKKVETN